MPLKLFTTKATMIWATLEGYSKWPDVRLRLASGVKGDFGDAPELSSVKDALNVAA